MINTNIYTSVLVVARLVLALVCAGAFAGCASTSGGHSMVAPAAALRSIFGTYDAEPRKADKRVDVDRLVTELVKIRANTYNFLVHHQSNDWEDLKLFLPKARENHIKVWITLVPPSEPPYSQPFGLDFAAWGRAIAQLSLQETNLVAWSIDDFSYDAPIFTSAYLKAMVDDSHGINPRLAFVPCMYYHQMKPARVAKYRPFVDGILFPYRHEMGQSNLSEWDTLDKEIAAFRQWFGPTVPIVVDVYATKHSKLNDSTPEYVRQVMTIAHQRADGVIIFCHQYQDRSPDKYAVIETLFDQWSDAKPTP